MSTNSIHNFLGQWRAVLVESHKHCSCLHHTLTLDPGASVFQLWCYEPNKGILISLKLKPLILNIFHIFLIIIFYVESVPFNPQRWKLICLSHRIYQNMGAVKNDSPVSAVSAAFPVVGSTGGLGPQSQIPPLNLIFLTN